MSHPPPAVSIEPFNRLVKLTARAFYDDFATKGDQPKSGRSDNRGIAVVILDALTRRAWVREEELAKELKLHTKQLRRTLRFFEEEKLITRDHRKESAKGAKVYNAAVAAAIDGQHTGKEGEEKVKMHTHSYCCLDYAQIYDVVRYRLHRMKKKLRDELDSKNTVQEYICPNCGKRYTALDAIRLISPDDDYFHCESCNGELVAESDKIASQGLADGDDNARRHRRETLEKMLRRMEEQLKPLMDQLVRVKDLPVPEFGSLQAWELQASSVARGANGDLNGNDPSKSSQGGTPMPFVGETKVEVAFSGHEEKGDNVKSEGSSSPMKVLPPWMIKQGMNLTKEQRGEAVKQEKMDGTSAPMGLSDDKKSEASKDDVKNIQDEYVKAYYAALLQQQYHQQEAAAKKLKEEQSTDDAPSMSTERQVGMKFKREDDDEGDDVEWEDAIPAGSGSNTTGNFKVGDLNVQAEATEDEDDDDIDWEEG